MAGALRGRAAAARGGGLQGEGKNAQNPPQTVTARLGTESGKHTVLAWAEIPFRKFSLEWRRVRGDPMSAYLSVSKAGGQQDGARPLSVLPSDRMRSSGCELKHSKFHLSMR